MRVKVPVLVTKKEVMNLIKIIGHPIAVMSMYLLLIISGQSFGGFYLLYILLGLPHGVPDAILAVTGLGLMLLGYKLFRKRYNPVKPLLYTVSIAVMIYSLVVFFRLSKGYNDPTFHQTVPLISFALFGVCVSCNLFLSAALFVKRPDESGNHLKAVS
jgi:Na+/melibiose symporter-like transporter